MSTFNRQFDVDGAEKAVQLSENAWFRDLLKYWRPAGEAAGDLREPQKEPQQEAVHLRLAIRDGYLNFYRAGQSVAKVSFVRGKLQWEVHNKYVYGDEASGQKYLTIADGWFKDHNGARVQYRDDLVHDWILKANEYADNEKRFVDNVVAHQAGSIDLEAGLPADPGLWDKKSAPRMDLVTIGTCGDHYRLAFWEAKLVTNKEARCKNVAAAPMVIAQLKKYEAWLSKNRKLVCNAYQRCCEDLVRLHGVARGLNPDMPELGNAVVAVGQKAAPLCVDGTPRLVIDATRGDAAFSQNGHLKKLHELGICVQMVRTPADMTLGGCA